LRPIPPRLLGENLAKFIRSAAAEDDLLGIWGSIAPDNPRAADSLLDRIDVACGHLAQHPDMGPARPDLAAELRYFVVGRYLILYRKIAGGVEIVRVVHGARHLPDLF
jgi:toxin ParE1/3/4